MNNAVRYTFENSKSEEAVPFLITPGRGKTALHSLVDPKREAQRLISQISSDTGFLIFLGLGGGFAQEAALDMTSAQIVVIDFDKEGIDQLFSGRNYSKLLNSGRFSLLVDQKNDDIKNFILDNYKPSLAGGIRIIPLRARIEHDRERFENVTKTIEDTIDIITGDYSVQAHFGIRWFSNIIRNVKNLDMLRDTHRAAPLSGFMEFKKKAADKVKKTAIAAAGPSLDFQLTSLAQMKADNVFIICCDTALGALLQHGIEPDAVVSIDCQHISYYHFMGSSIQKKIQNIPLILDIASPPLLSGFSASPLFFASAHPLARYLCASFLPFTQLDTSGGNVTYTCLSLAESLGAQRITLFGADFSYVGNQTYARGTYINPYFSRRQNRLSPLEAQMSSFLYRSPFLPAAGSENKNYYETSSLRFYREKLEEKISTMAAIVECAKGFGAPVRVRSGELGVGSEELGVRSDKKYLSGMDFLAQYSDDIASLPQAKDSGDYLKTLNAKEKQVFTTLLPFAAAVRKRNPQLTAKDLIEEVKRQSISDCHRVQTEAAL